MKTTFSTCIAAVALGFLVSILSGCATPALWRQTAAHDWKPRPPDHLWFRPISGNAPAVIVSFEQWRSQGTSIISRDVAWCPDGPASDLLSTGSAAKSIQARYQDIQSMPLLWEGDTPPSHGTAPPGFGIWDPGQNLLTICLDEFPPGPYALPATHTDTHAAARICLLPLAIAADAALICGVCMWLGMGGGCY